MRCIRCGKEIGRPLELLNGGMRCPVCFRSVSPEEGEFCVTDENEGWMSLSDVYFNEYLCLSAVKGEKTSKKDGKETEGDRTDKKKKFYLGQALRYCEMAAEERNPLAFVMTGFYHYKGYTDYGPGYGKYKVAYLYLSSVTEKKNRDSLFKAYESYFRAQGRSDSMRLAAERRDSVIVKAVGYMEDMFITASDFFSSPMAAGKYNISAAVDALRTNLDDMHVDLDGFSQLSMRNAAAGEQKAAQIRTIFDICGRKGGVRAPVFGFYRLDAGDYIDICDMFAEDPALADRVSRFGIAYSERQGDMLRPVAYDYLSADGRTLNGIYDRIYFYFVNDGAAVKKTSVGGVKYVPGVRRVLGKISVHEDDELMSIIDTASGGGQNLSEEQVFWPDDAYFADAYLSPKYGSVSEAFISLMNEKYDE